MRATLPVGRLTASLGLALAACSAVLLLLGAPNHAQPALAAPGEWRVCNSAGGYSTTIQSAVDAAQPGDNIKVAAGIYTESKVISGNPFNLYISKTVHLYGGYTCANWTTPNPAANVVTIRPTTTLISVVMLAGTFGNGALFTPTVDGFTISGGGGGNHGGGMRLVDSNALINHNIISGNVAYLLGGGIWAQRGAPQIQDNVIENNRIYDAGADGGGVELEDTQATLNGNFIAGNVISSSAGYGGGIAIVGGGPVSLDANTILSNTAAAITSTLPQSDIGYGGGVYVSSAAVKLSGNVIQGNVANRVYAFGFGGAYGYGGGVYVNGSPTFTLTGNTLVNNIAGYKYYVYPSGGGIEIDGSSGIMAGNIISGNAANGNILFGNGGGVAVYTSTLHLQGDQVVNNKTAINAEGYGGGLYARNSIVTIDSARFTGNAAANTPAYGLGGGMAFFSSAYTLTNSLLAGNVAFGNDTSVGGVYAGANSSGLLVNNTLAANRGQAIRSASPLTLTNNIIVSHTTGVSITGGINVSVTYNDFYNNTTNQRGFSLDVSNIVINPQLDADFHLMPGSPAIDAGTRLNAPDHDIDGQPRPMLGLSSYYRFDIGADEFIGTPQIARNLATQPADFTLIGPGNPTDNPGSDGTNDWIGNAVGAGDVNGDGKSDLLVGAPNLSGDFDGGTNDDGRVFALLNTGARRLGVLDLYTTTADLEVRSWLHQQHIGQAFASGDLNGDGKGDLIIGASGAANFNVTGTVFVFTGSSGLSGVRTLSPTLQANYRIRSDQNTASFGGANALAAEQLNGVGPDDLAVGEANATVLGRNMAGAVYVFFGGNSLPAVWDMRVLSPSLSIYGPTASAELGRVAIADVNGDGTPDLIARSMYTLYVFYGPLAAGTIDLAVTPASLTIGGLTDGRLAAGDVDGDGKADIIIGSGNQVLVIRGSNGSTMTRLSGVTASALLALDWNGDGKAEVVIGDLTQRKVFVVNGSASLSGGANVFDRADMIISGENQPDQFGFSLGGGDLDGDGALDLILGSRTHVVGDHPLHFEDAGAIYVLYGSGSVQRRLYLPLVER